MQNTILNPRRDFTVTVDGYTFFGMIPLPREEMAIDVRVAQSIQGMPLQSIPESSYQYTVMCETLNLVIKEKPTEFDSLTDWMQHPDPDFVSRVFEQYSRKYEEFRKGLKKNNNNRPGENSSQPGSANGPVHAEQVQNPSGQSDGRQPVPGAKVVPDGSGSTTRGHEQHTGKNPAIPASSNARIPG